MKRHPFEKYLITRDDYLEKPYDLIEMSKDIQFNRSPVFPGARTDNLLASPNPEIKKFAEWFTNQISYDIFPGIFLYETYLCFHKYDLYEEEEFNIGWIHNDVGNLAGLIYLTPEEDNINTGTSIFSDVPVQPEELPTDARARELCYVEKIITPEFKSGFDRNKQIFESKETIRVGNKFNRLVAYDSKMWHRPNNYGTACGETRLSLLFFISQFNYTK